MKEILEKLFGSSARVRIMRLFLFNPTSTFDVAAVGRRSKTLPDLAESETALFDKIGFIKKRHLSKEVKRGKGMVKTKVTGWTLNPDFEFSDALRALLVSGQMKDGEIARKLARAGKVKLVILSGMFIQNFDSRVDLCIVLDAIKKPKLDAVIKTIESELGRELRYSAFTTADFNYRKSMHDKLIRDILEYPHVEVINRLSSEAI